jgi:hypothetical protein
MKKIALTFCGLALVVLAVAQQVVLNSGPLNQLVADDAAFAWSATTFDFGKVTAGKPVSHEFAFTNTGDSPLVITSVKASCGCTVTSYSKDPILPGASGFVKATYNAAKVGQFTKTVTVNANIEESIILTIQGEVVEGSGQTR